MDITILFIASFIITASVSRATSLPKITKCKSDDDGCITANAVKVFPVIVAGIPELGVESMDPAFYESVDCSTPDFKFILSNFTISGLKDCKVLDVHRNKPKAKLYVKLLCSLKGKGQYELSGNILGIDVNGYGAIDAHIKSFEPVFEADFEEIDGQDGKKYFNIKNQKHGAEFRDKADIEFKNLQASDEKLTCSINKLIKENGNEILMQLGGPIFAASNGRIIKKLNSFFSSMPVKELSID